MNKNELIIGIIELTDENERLKREVEVFKNRLTTKTEIMQEEPSHMVLEVIDYGNKSLLNNCLYNWEKVEVKYNDEKDSYYCTKYEDWLVKKICKEEIPETISRAEFFDYFSEQLQALYKKEKDVAIREAKGIENVEDK